MVELNPCSRVSSDKGLETMGMVTISIASSVSSAVAKYKDVFDHGPSLEAYKFMSQEDLDQTALAAVKAGLPVEDWKNRHKIPTGTLLDKAYGLAP